MARIWSWLLSRQDTKTLTDLTGSRYIQVKRESKQKSLMHYYQQCQSPMPIISKSHQRIGINTASPPNLSYSTHFRAVCLSRQFCQSPISCEVSWPPKQHVCKGRKIRVWQACPNPVHSWSALQWPQASCDAPRRDPPLARTLGLLAEQKLTLCRMRWVSGRWLSRLCRASSAISSSAPSIFRIICWPSSLKDKLRSNFSQRLKAGLGAFELGFSRDSARKCWEKLLWKTTEEGRGENQHLWAAHYPELGRLLPLGPSWLDTFCRRPLQSRDAARLANRQKARRWWPLFSGASSVANFMTLCITEPPVGLLWTGACPGPLQHSELQAAGRGHVTMIKGKYTKLSFIWKNDISLLL